MVVTMIFIGHSILNKREDINQSAVENCARVKGFEMFSERMLKIPSHFTPSHFAAADVVL